MTGQIERPVPYIPATLKESFGTRLVDEQEVGVVQIIDSIRDLNLPQKRDIYFYDIWSRDPSRALMAIRGLIGEVREDELERVLLRVQTDNFMIEQYNRFNNKYIREFKLVPLLNKGVSLEKAMVNLGIIIDPIVHGDSNAEKFADFCRKVELIEHPQIADYEIARVLGATEGRVSKARKRLRMNGFASPRTAKDVASANSRRLIPLRQKVYRMTLIGKSSTSIRKETGASYHQFTHQRDKLVAEGKLPKKMSKEEAKSLLLGYLNEFRRKYGRKARVNLSALYKEQFVGKRISLSSINNCYHELASEYDVPKLNFSPKRKIKSE